MELLGLFEKNLAWAAIFGSFVADTTGLAIHRAGMGIRSHSVRPGRKEGRKKTVSCERGHLSMTLRPSCSPRGAQALFEGRALKPNKS